jgi:hypothetical protein
LRFPDDKGFAARRAFREFDGTSEADVGGLDKMEVGPIGRFQTGEIGLQQFKRVIGVEESSSFGLHFLITGTGLDPFQSIDIFLGDVIDRKFIDGVDSVIIYLFVFLHRFIVIFIREDNIL